MNNLEFKKHLQLNFRFSLLSFKFSQFLALPEKRLENTRHM